MDVRGIGLERQLRKEMPLGRRWLGGGVLEDKGMGGGRAHSRAPDGVTAMSPGDPVSVKCELGDADADDAWPPLCPYRPPREQRRPCREEAREPTQVKGERPLPPH